MNGLPQLRLHHVGFVVNSIETTSDQYIRRYGYQVRTPIIHDPSQTAFVQFLQLPGDNTFLELVAPDSPTSKLFSAAQRGGKLHHLCYTADRFDDTLPHLESNGMVLISQPIPAVAFAGRRICWLMDDRSLLVELIERRDETDTCQPGFEDGMDASQW